MAAIISEGATLEVGASSADTTVSQVTSLSISHSRDTIDVSNLATTGAKDFIAAKLYEAELTCELQFDDSDSGQAAALADISGAGDTTAIYWQITLSDSSTFDGTGFVTSFDVNASQDSAVTGSITIKVDGAVTVA